MCSKQGVHEVDALLLNILSSLLIFHTLRRLFLKVIEYSPRTLKISSDESLLLYVHLTQTILPFGNLTARG